MKEFIEKLIARLEEEAEYQYKESDKAEEDVFEEISVSKARAKMGDCYNHSIEIVNQLAEEYKDKEYCWQECASTEHCKECSRLGNGDIDYFESIDDWAESLTTIDAGELLGNGWIPCEKEKPPINQNILVYDVVSGMYIERLEEDEEFIGTVIAWQPLPAPYQPKGE